MINRQKNVWVFECDVCGRVERYEEHDEGRATRTPPLPKGWGIMQSLHWNTKRYAELCKACYAREKTRD